jgi:hypothetical protein
MIQFVSYFRAAAFAVVLLPMVTTAQQASPEVLARQQLDAVNRSDWAAYAASIHPKALGRMQEMMLPIVDLAASKDAGAGENMRAALFGGRSAADLKAMSSKDFFEIFMSSISKLPGLADALKNARGEVLGQVKEGENLVHVVTRTSTSIPGVPVFTKMEVMSFERDGDQWKGLLSGDMELQLAQLMQQVAAAPAPAAANPARATTPAATPAGTPAKAKAKK